MQMVVQLNLPVFSLDARKPVAAPFGEPALSTSSLATPLL